MKNLYVKSIEEVMKLCVEKAKQTMKDGVGGPFGAGVVRYDLRTDRYEVISIESNSVLGDLDPTAHAEVNAIRVACKNLQTIDLSDCILVTTGQSCPMCVSAIAWSRIPTVFYGTTYEDANKLGFIDEPIEKHIKKEEKLFDEIGLYRDIAIELHNIWDKKQDRVDY